MPPNTTHPLTAHYAQKVLLRLTNNPARFSLGYIVLTFGIRTYAIALVPHQPHTKRCAGFARRYGPGWRNTRHGQFLASRVCHPRMRTPTMAKSMEGA